MSSYNPSGKIQRIPGGNLNPPGGCFSCGSASQSVYALVGHTDWEGSVYLCKACTLESMTIFDELMVPANEKALREEIEQLEIKNQKLAKRYLKLKEQNDSYRSVFADIGRDSDKPSGSAGSASPSYHPNDGNIVSQTPGFHGESDNFNDSADSGSPQNATQLVKESIARSNRSNSKAASDASGSDSEPSDSKGRDNGSGTGREKPRRAELPTI